MHKATQGWMDRMNEKPDVYVNCGSLENFLKNAVSKGATEIQRYKGRALIDGKVYQYVPPSIVLRGFSPTGAYKIEDWEC